MTSKLARGVERLGLVLNPDQLNRFGTYYRELAAWNQKVNLTAITDFDDVQIKHFLDSLTVALALPSPIPAGFNLLDVGTGAGFPGLPLKLLFPEIHLTLLEATGKKVAFLKYLISALELADTAVLTGRAEEVAHRPEHRAHYNMVTSRAVARLPALLELTLPFCLSGGYVVAQKKGDVRAELDEAAHALEILGGKLIELKDVTLPVFPDRRYLVLVAKTASTPAAYPRRPGIPAKQPLV